MKAEVAVEKGKREAMESTLALVASFYPAVGRELGTRSMVELRSSPMFAIVVPSSAVRVGVTSQLPDTGQEVAVRRGHPPAVFPMGLQLPVPAPVMIVESSPALYMIEMSVLSMSG